MNENKLRRILQSHKSDSSRGWRCPDDNDLARYVSGQLENKKRKSVESHLAGCKFCLDAVGFLTTAEEWSEAEAVQPELLRRARALAQNKRKSTWDWRWAMATAATACVLIVVGFTFLRSRVETTQDRGPLVAQEKQPDYAIKQSAPAVQSPSTVSANPNHKTTPSVVTHPTVRSATQSLKPTLVFPREGAVIKRSDLQFTWSPIADSIAYEVNLVSEEGNQVFHEANIMGNELRLPNDATLTAGTKYFVTVIAHMKDGRTEKSEIISFRLAK